MSLKVTNHEDIKRLGTSLAEGESVRVRCPRCNGGQSGEVSFRITNYGTHIGFHCFRAKCDLVPGDIPTTGLPPQLREGRTRSVRTNPFEGEFVSLPQRLCEITLGVYGISYEHASHRGVRYMPKEERIYLPILDVQGRPFGGVGKAIEKARHPKTVTYFEDETPLAHFTSPVKGHGILWLVEDWISAEKCSLVNVTAVALLGDTMKKGVKSVILDSKPAGIVCLLDGDVAGWEGNDRLQRQLQDYVPVIQWPLPQGIDPKDLSLEKLQRIKEYTDVKILRSRSRDG